MRTYVPRDHSASSGQLLVLPKPGEHPSLEDIVISLVARRPHLPTVEVVLSLPRLHEGRCDADKRLAEGLNEELGGTSPPRSRPCHPARNAYIAAEVAVMLDIERKPQLRAPTKYWGKHPEERRLDDDHCPTCGKPLTLKDSTDEAADGLDRVRRACPSGHSFSAATMFGLSSVRSYLRGLDPGIAITRDGTTDRSKTVGRWRDTGRALLADLGAWPWAIVAGGGLARTWWTDSQFAAALVAWSSQSGQAT